MIFELEVAVKKGRVLNDGGNTVYHLCKKKLYNTNVLSNNNFFY